MWGVTQRYLDTLAKPHTQLAYLDILHGGQPVATVQGGYTDPGSGDSLFLIDGQVRVDKTTVRREGTFTLLNPGGKLIPQDVEDLLAEYVTEIRAWVGVRYWDAPLPVPYTSQTGGQLIAGVPPTEVEYVPVGTLVVTDVDTSNFPQITCQCYDRAWLLANFPAPYSVAAAADPSDAISDVLSLFVPAARLQVNFPIGADLSVPATTFDADSSGADACFNIAGAVGWQFYADPMGTFTVAAQPTTDDQPVLSLTPAPGASLMRPTRHTGESVGQMYNAVVFTSEGGSTAPLRGYAQDDDPSSRTYVGRVGIRPYFASQPGLTTAEQCNQMALTWLRSILGIATELGVPIMPNHALESGDVIHVTDDQQGINESVIVDSFTVALRASAGPQLLTCRPRVTS